MLSKEQEIARNAVIAGHNVLVTGQAGSGKSFWLGNCYSALKAARKSVHVLSTTGMSALNLGNLKATTVHRWAGLLDGRYNSEQLQHLVQHDDRFEEVRQRAGSCDVLLIDEVSMLSRKIFEQLELVCRVVKKNKFLFGGMQIAMTGDFLQLPPVHNIMQQDPGEYCFKSEYWRILLPHHVQLSGIYRQQDQMLIQAVKETSLGTVSEETEIFLGALSRPIHNIEAVHLFTTSYFTELYNAEQLEENLNEQKTYFAIDKGPARLLKSVQAPKVLAIKVGCPVMLIKNHSNMLVNGLQGRVELAEADHIDVYFPKLDITHSFTQKIFEVYSCLEKNIIATRQQFPLCLSYAMSIHKSQGSTLRAAVVDCKGCFEAGQISVALGRVKDSQNLQVLNFKPSLCPAPTKDICKYYNETSKPFKKSLDCCQLHRVDLNVELENKSENDFAQCALETCSNLSEDSDFDLDELEIIEELALDQDLLMAAEDAEIKPLEVDEDEKIVFDPLVLCSKVLACAKNSPMESALQKVFRQINQREKELIVWSQRQYSKCVAIMSDTVKTSEKSTAKQWSDYYSTFYQYTVSSIYMESVKELFHIDELTEEQTHFATSLLLEVQNELLQKKRDSIPECDLTKQRTCSTKVMSDGGRGKVRYVGAMCIAKVRYHLRNHILNNLYKPLQKETVSNSKKKLEMIEDLISTYQELSEETNDPESLGETERKQNVRHSLLHINDKCANFFMLLTHCIQQKLTQENLSIHKSQLASHVMDSIYDSHNVMDTWLDMFQDKASILANELLKALLDRYVKVNIKQFRKDMIDALNMSKKEAHRKAILKKAESMKSRSTNISYKEIQQDQSEKKGISHLKMQAAVLENCNFFNSTSFTKKQLQCLCESYDLDYIQGHTKQQLNDKLVQQIQDPELRHMLRVLPEAPSRTSRKRKVNQRGNNFAKKHVLYCEKCKKANEDEHWIKCDMCEKCFHRDCAGITDEIWNTIEKDNGNWVCETCN